MLRLVRSGKIRLLGLVLFGAELDPEHRRGFGLELVGMYIEIEDRKRSRKTRLES